MYTSIRFGTLQLHSGNDTEHNTLSKTIAVYEKDFFLYNEKETPSVKNISKEVKRTITKSSKKLTGQYSDLLSQFVWHMN